MAKEKIPAKPRKERSAPKEGPSAVASILYYVFVLPIKIVFWPFTRGFKSLYTHFISYIVGHVVRDSNRVYSIKFVWYNDSVYLHPMIWGSLILFGISSGLGQAGGVIEGAFDSSWLLLIWFVLLGLSYVTIMYNFNVINTAILAVTVLALLGGAFFSTIQWAWNPLQAVSYHTKWMHANVTPGFYLASAYVFLGLIVFELIWAWLFHRVEIDESYVYEHQFMKTSTREPIFARALRRETKDLLELLLLGAADIQHRTRSGAKTFKNVPFASLWLGTNIDRMLDHRRPGQIALEKEQGRYDSASEVRHEDAFGEDMHDDYDDGGGSDWDDSGDPT